MEVNPSCLEAHNEIYYDPSMKKSEGMQPQLMKVKNYRMLGEHANPFIEFQKPQQL